MTARQELFGEVRDVLGDATRIREVVRGDERDLHSVRDRHPGLCFGPPPLEDSPLLRMIGDIVLQAFGHSLSYAQQVLLAIARALDVGQWLQPRIEAPVRLARRDRDHDGRPGTNRQPGRAFRKARRRVEEAHDRAGARHVAVGDEANDLVPAQRHEHLARGRRASGQQARAEHLALLGEKVEDFGWFELLDHARHRVTQAGQNLGHERDAAQVSASADHPAACRAGSVEVLDAVQVDQCHELLVGEVRHSQRVPVVQGAVVKDSSDEGATRRAAQHVTQVVAHGRARVGTAEVPQRAYQAADGFGVGLAREAAGADAGRAQACDEQPNT